MFRNNCNYKSKSHKIVLYDKSQATIPKIPTFCENDYTQEHIHLPNIYKENWNRYTRSLEQSLHRDQDTMSTILEETSLTNSMERQTRSTKMKRKHNGIEESPLKKALKYNTEEVLNECEKSSSSPPLEKCSSPKMSDTSIVSEAVEVNDKTTLKPLHDNNFSCNSIMLKEHQNEIHFKSDFKMKPVREEIDKSTTEQPIFEGNVQDFIDLNPKIICDTVSVRFEQENTYEANNSIAVGEVKKRKDRKKKYLTSCLKPTSHKIYHRKPKYEQHMNKTIEKKYFKSMLKEKNLNNESKITTLQSVETDIEVNKDVNRQKHRVEMTKQLVVSLTRYDELNLNELTKLLRPPKRVENEQVEENTNKMYYQNNVTETLCSAQTTEVEQNEEIDMLYHESLFKEKDMNYEGNMIEQIGANIKNIEVKTNECRVPPEENENNTNILSADNEESNLRTTHWLENILNFFVNTRNVYSESKKYRSIFIEKMQKAKARKCVAMCSKCKETFSLLCQLSRNMTLANNEKLSIECELCSVQMVSLAEFQKHVVKAHLQCEKLPNGKDKRFVVHYVDSNDQPSTNDKERIVFVCCCCYQMFKRLKAFQNHLSKVHYGFDCFVDSIEKNKISSVDDNTELYTALRNKQVHSENHILDSNTTNITEISNKTEEISNSSDTSETSYKKNVHCNQSHDKNLMLTIEADNTNFSSISQTVETTPEIEENLSLNKNHLRRTRKLKTSSGTNSPGAVNMKQNYLKRRDTLTCTICDKKYVIYVCFLKHMYNHIRVRGRKKHFNNNNELMSYIKTNLIALSKTSKDGSSIKNSLDSAGSSKNNDALNHTGEEETNEEELNQCSVLGVNDKEVFNTLEDKNTEYVRKEDTVSTRSDNLNETLHMNLIQESDECAETQEMIKFNTNVTRNYNTNIDGQENTENETEENSLTDLGASSGTNQKNITYGLRELFCNLCDKKFRSQTMLKEHIFYSHDSPFRCTSLPISYGDYHNMENTPGAEIDKMLSNVAERGSEIDQRNKMWRCEPCKENFVFLGNHLRHRYYCHNDESMVHICDNCNILLTSIEMVNNHKCTGVTEWKCKRCDVDFLDGLILLQHNRNHHFETMGRHHCERCQLNFLTNYMLERHKANHSVSNSYTNFGYFTNSSIKNYLPSIVDVTNIDSEFIKSNRLINDHTIENLNRVDELNEKFLRMYMECSASDNNGEGFRCKRCNTLCTTELQLKVHIEECGKVEVCLLCGDLHFVYELAKHIIQHHMVSDDLSITIKEEALRNTEENERINFKDEVMKILGLERLLALFEYQRYDNFTENEFDCADCSEQFSDVQSYKIHYLKSHDKICILCNIEFENNVQTLEHAIKIHRSIDLYLWVVEKVILAVLHLTECKNMEELILKCSEISI